MMDGSPEEGSSSIYLRLVDDVLGMVPIDVPFSCPGFIRRL